MFSSRQYLLKVKVNCISENVCFQLRNNGLDLKRGHSQLRCDKNNNVGLTIFKQNPRLAGSKFKTISTFRNVLMQPNSYHLTLPIQHRCFFQAVKSCFYFGLSLSTMGVKHFVVKEPFTAVMCSSQTNHNNRQLRRYYNSKKETVNTQQLLDSALKNAEMPGIVLESPRSRGSQRRRDRIKKNVDYDDADDTEEKPPTVEKKLLSLMEMWKMDDAVDLLLESLRSGFTPNSGVILNLLQQLAHLGEVDNILELHDEFLEGKAITRQNKFYALLTEAYCNSGRVEEGIAMLRIIYHKTRNFDETDPFFSMITIMVIRNFEHHFHLIKDFVDDLTESDPPVDKAVACLWKCLVLTERFDQADALVEEHENLSKFIPAKVSDIVNVPFYITYNKDTVLPWLMHLPPIKKPLKASIFETLIQSKCEDNKWQEALDSLRDAMTTEEAFVRQSTLTHFLSNFLSQLSDNQVEELEEWATRLEEQNLSENEPDNHDVDNKDS